MSVVDGVSKFGHFVTSVGDYFDNLKKEGFFIATFGMNFGELVITCIREVAKFILFYKDIFILFPNIALMFITFLIGKNKYTKYIIPLWFIYFVVTVIEYTVVKK